MAKGIGRNGELYRVLCDPAHLIRSARAAAKGKKRRPDAARFLLDMEPDCFRLAAELADGSWNNNTNNVRSSNRNNNTPDNTNNNIGFRVASTRDQQVSM
jgi:formylglycine-generating enzyme required for sulfatase activity